MKSIQVLRGQLLKMVAAALLIAAARFTVAAPAPKYGISHTTLENGMEIIVIENHALPLVTLEIAAKNGAYTQPPEFDGLAHLYEHMFFKGNSVIPDQERYMERLRELGAQWNGTTSEELVNYFMTITKKNLDEGAAFLRDALRYPLFKQEELKHEWPVVLGEFDRNEADPGFHLEREVERRLWFKYYSRKNTIGDRDVIFNTTQAQMREIQHRYYVPNNCAFIVAGDVEPEAIYKLAKDLYGDWPRAEDPHKKWPEPEHPPLPETKRVVVTMPVKTASIKIAWEGPGMVADTPSTYAADCFSYILAQPDSAFQKALVDSGLVDGAGISYQSLVHTGPIDLNAATSADRLDKAWAAINAQIEEFDAPDYITDDQIETAKNMLEISEIYEREQTSGFANSIAFWWSTGGIDYYLNYIDNLRKVKRDDLVRYVQKYIKGKKRIEGALVSPEDAKKIEFAKTAEIIQPKSGSSAVAFSGEGGKKKPDAEEKTTTEEFDVDGLKVVLRRNPTSEVAVAEMVFIGGLEFYGPENSGKELVLLETLDKGSAKFSKEEVNRQLARTGASLFPEARQDFSAFGLQTLTRDLNKNFPIFADAITHPLLSADEVKLAVERRLNAIKEMEQSPDAYISVLSSRNFYKGHPYEVPPQGTEKAVKGLAADDVKKIHDETLVRSRAKLFIYANLTKDDVAKLVREGFKDLPAGKFERRKIIRDAKTAPSLLIEKRELPTNYIFGAFDAPGVGTKDYPAFVAAASILSDRLFREVRTKRNLTYAVAAQLSARLSNYGVLYVTAVKPNDTIKVMFDTVQHFTDEKLPEKDLHDKIEEMITGDLIGKQSGRSQIGELILYDVNGPGWQEEEHALDKMRDVTAADVQEVAKRYLKGFSFAVLGNPDQIDKKLFSSK